ncbi:elongation factor Ts [Candidatus Roizmanbacteria bacterium]|nr:elongation factor Ts [Candidatus Roizmanbacteria bacterium]
MADIQKLKQLREETGVSFSLCKKALDETNDNIEAAKKKLNEWGAEKVKDKAERTTSQGGIFSYVHHNKKIASLVELQCETDFVGGNVEFQKLGNELAMQIASVPAETSEEFLKQAYIRDAKKSIDDLIKEAVLKFGENIKVARFIRWTLGE